MITCREIQVFIIIFFFFGEQLRFNKFILFRFFQGIDWPKVSNKKLAPPLVPNVMANNDTRHYILYKGNSDLASVPAPEEHRKLFQDF